MLRRSGRGKRRGAVLMETAIVLPPCLFVMLAIMDFARYEMARQLTLNAARSGARMAVTSKRSATTAQVQAQVVGALAGFGGSNPQVSVYQADASGNNVGAWNLAGPGQPIAVQVVIDYVPLLPTFGLLANPSRVSVKVAMLCELN